MTAQRYALHRCPGCGQWTPDERCSRCARAAPVPDLYAPHKPVVMPRGTPTVRVRPVLPVSRRP